ncbi:MAG: ABC transporter permease subunit, partial [Bacillota bacterium]
MKRQDMPAKSKTPCKPVSIPPDEGMGSTEWTSARATERVLRSLPVATAVYPALAVLVLVPLFARNYYYLRAGGSCGLYLILALGLNIVAGEAGLLDLGYVAFYGIGAYVYALLSSPQFGLHAPFLLSATCSVLAAVSAAVLVSVPTLHLRGDYLAMVTLGFGQIVRILLNNLDRPVNITNGPNGIVGVDAPNIFGVSFASLEMSYVLIWVVAAGVAIVVSRVTRSKIGRAWAAIREDEVAAACMGVDVARYRVMAFSWGAGLAGLAGALLASWQRAVFPQNFTMTETIAVYCMIILGGMRSLPGVMVGPLVLVILPELLRAYSVYRMLIYGVALVLLVVYRPQGLLPAGASISVPIRRLRRAARRVPDMESSTGAAQAPARGTPGPEHRPTDTPLFAGIVVTSPAQDAVQNAKPFREAALEVKGVVCKFGGLVAVSDVSLTVRQGEVVGIIGPNGAGKTTLFNLITGIAKPFSGDIRVFGEDISSMPPYKIAALGVARTFQNIRLFDSQSVLENVLAGCHLRLPGGLPGIILRTRAFRAHEASEIVRAKGAVNFFGPELAAKENAPVNSLTYPDRRRVELARALAAGPRILLLDEPTAGMTPEEAGDVVEEIRLLRESGYTVLVIEHHMDVVADTCDRVIVLDHGEKIAEGTPAEVASNPEVMQAYLGAPSASGGAAELVADRLVGPAGSGRRIATQQ